MKFAFKLVHKGLALLGTFLIAVLVLLLILTGLFQQSLAEALKEAESKEVAGRICAVLRVLSAVNDASADLQPGGEVPEAAKKKFHEKSIVIRKELEDLSLYVQKLPEYKAPVDRVVHKVRAVLRMADISLGMDPSLDPQQSAGVILSLLKQVKKSTIEQQLVDDVDEVLQLHHTTVARAIAAQQSLRGWMELALALLVFITIGFAIVLGVTFLKGFTGRISILTDNANRLAKGLPLHPEMNDSDEIGDLDRSFRAMDKTLAESARKERAIVENARDVICTIDSQGCFVKVNPACSKVWGFSPESLIAKPLSDLVVFEERSLLADILIECFAGRQEEFELKMLKENGESLYMLWSASWSKAERILYCVAHDLSERKRAEEQQKASEQQIRAILDNMAVGLATSSSSGLLETFNAKMELITGYESAEMLGESIYKLFNDSHSFTSAAPNSGFELEIVHKSGVLVPVELSKSEFQTPHGLRQLVNVLDISERLAIEKAKREFLAMISHDLRTPLASVSLFLEVLESGVYGDLKPDEEQGAQQAIHHAQSLLGLINDLLEITRLETSKLDLKLKNISLEKLLAGCLSSANKLAARKGVSVNCQLEEAEFQADSGRIKRVVDTLLSYMINSSPEGSSISISSANQSAAVELRITDSGPPIPKSEQPLLFDWLSRGSSASRMRKDDERADLALPICKAIVKQHAGSIGIDSNEDATNTFWIRLPKQSSGAESR